jgi:hypothetical protein
MNEPKRGACLCGAITFEVAPPYRWFAHCHCSVCRKQHGALFSTGLGVARERFRWLTGEDQIVHYRVTGAFERPFCRHCGSALPADSHDPETLHVPAGLLDGELDGGPRTHIFVSSKSPCDTITDSLPQFAAYPPGLDLPITTLPPPPAPSQSARVAGSCLCGTIGFEATNAPRKIVCCHCSLCRRSYGTAFGPTTHVPRQSFRWTRGRDRLRTHRLQPPHSYATTFCADCGSLLPGVASDVRVALLPLGAIDTALPVLPMVHIFVGSKAPWDEITDEWPSFDELPPPEQLDEVFG